MLLYKNKLKFPEPTFHNQPFEGICNTDVVKNYFVKDLEWISFSSTSHPRTGLQYSYRPADEQAFERFIKESLTQTCRCCPPLSIIHVAMKS